MNGARMGLPVVCPRAEFHANGVRDRRERPPCLALRPKSWSTVAAVRVSAPVPLGNTGWDRCLTLQHFGHVPGHDPVDEKKPGGAGQGVSREETRVQKPYFALTPAYQATPAPGS
jgi:hypothetical protein